MLLYGLNAIRVHEAVALACADNGWGANLRADITREWDTCKGPRVRFVLRTNDSYIAPSRMSASAFTQRHTRGASWEAHYAVLRILFDKGAERIVSAMADYTSDTFEDKARGVRYRNVGAPIYPIAFGDLSI